MELVRCGRGLGYFSRPLARDLRRAARCVGSAGIVAAQLFVPERLDWIHSRRASCRDEAGREARCAQRQDAEPRPYSNGLKAVWNGRRCAQLIGLENAEGRHGSASREYSRKGAWIRQSEWRDRHLRCATLVSVM